MDNQQNGDSSGLKRVNVVLSREVLLWLDRTAWLFRENTGATINRSELIRAIIGGFADVKLTMRGCRTERDIRVGLFRYLDRLTRIDDG